MTAYIPCRHIMLDQIIGSLGADLNFFHTKYCYEMLFEEAKDILLPKEVIKIQEKSVISLGGYSDDIISTDKYDKFTFIYNHRLDGYKNWKTTFNQFDKLWDKGLDFQVILTAGDKDNINIIAQKPYAIVKSFTKHSDYIKELSKCHANTINSRHETYCISIAESIMNEQVVILPNKLTFPPITPPIPHSKAPCTEPLVPPYCPNNAPIPAPANGPKAIPAIGAAIGATFFTVSLTFLKNFLNMYSLAIHDIV